MPTFQYKARTRNGELVSGNVEATDRRLALAELGRLGYFPLSVDAATQKPSLQTSVQGLRSGLSRRDVMMITQQLASLLRSGMALTQALEVLGRRAQKPAARGVLGALYNDVLQGASLSEAMSRHPKVFPGFYVNLIKAGEASGGLEQVLDRLRQHYERVGDIREKIVGALLYPLIVVLAGIGTMIFFMTFMVPRFAQMFKEMRRAMPLPTQILISTSDIVSAYWWVAVVALVLAVIWYRRTVRTPGGRLMLDRWKLRVPIIGAIVKAGSFAQFARTLATLLENGVPVLTALHIVEGTMTNKVIANELREARTRVTDGTSITQPLAKGKVFPPLLLDMLAVGEESGEVVPALTNIADTYEQELEHRLRVFTTLLEPIIILAMALVVGSVVVSILLAVFDLTSGIGK
ncbi:MAG: type II secretion system F family protein [Verrucomicrobia bacterium]|nr:type II secretion system F family protein [Verrucomicrobiota bacterium]